MPPTGPQQAQKSAALGQQKQAAALTDLQQTQIDVAVLKSQRAADRYVTLRAGETRDKIDRATGAYGRLYTSLYASVGEAGASYTDILSMKDAPKTGLAETILQDALIACVVVLPELRVVATVLKTVQTAVKVAQWAERTDKIKEVLEAGQAIGKVLRSGTGDDDPNRGKALRIEMVRKFFAKLDESADAIGVALAQAKSIVTDWQYNPTFNLDSRLNQLLGKLGLSLTASLKTNTALATDFFLHDLLAAYVKGAVSLEYSVPFGRGDGAHLSPDDSAFDKFSKYMYVRGISEEGCKKIFQRFGEGGNTETLKRTGRSPVKRPGDLVSVWGARFYRYGREQVVENGKYVDQPWKKK